MGIERNERNGNNEMKRESREVRETWEKKESGMTGFLIYKKGSENDGKGRGRKMTTKGTGMGREKKGIRKGGNCRGNGIQGRR